MVLHEKYCSGKPDIGNCLKVFLNSEGNQETSDDIAR